MRVVTLERTYDAEKKCGERVNAPPGWKVVACAVWDFVRCHIIMKPDANDDVLGHETRHCFDGAWHR